MKKEKEQSSSEEQKAANENLLIRLNQNYGKLSKGQKRLADFITAHYDQAVSMTAARLGQQVGVSESTTGSLCDAAWLRGISGVPARTGGDGDEPSEFGAADAVYVWPRAAGRNSGDRPAVGH